MPGKSHRLLKPGLKTTSWLRDVGVFTLEDVEALGVIEVYRRLKRSRPHQVTLNALWGLQAALLNIPWTALPPDMKAELKAQVEALDDD
jgi:DNA transformation protein